jgi:transposase-like protein
MVAARLVLNVEESRAGLSGRRPAQSSALVSRAASRPPGVDPVSRTPRQLAARPQGRFGLARTYPAEFRRDAVALVRSSDKTVTQVAKELGLNRETLRQWVKQDRIDQGEAEGLTSSEQQELRRLRREVAELRMEREILKQAPAFSPRRRPGDFKLVPWQSIASAFSPALLVDTSWDPRLVGGGGTSTAPETTINNGPSGVVNDTNATFTFSSTDASATFQCRLDGAPFAACSSPQQYTGLTERSHTFEVRAVNSAGTADPTPASRTWTVDLTPPQVTAVAPADGASDVSVGIDVRATFAEAMDAATLNTTTYTLARADDGSLVTAPVSYDAANRTAILRPSSPLSPGATYRAKVTTGAKDVAGNPLAADKVWSFTTSTQPPPTGVRRESTSTAVNGTATGTVRIATPAGITPGDVLVACLALNGGAVTGTGVPTGWSPIASVTATANPHVFGYYKVAGPSEPTAYQWTLTSSVQNAGGIARYSGVDTARPLDGAAKTATGAAATAGTVPGVTTATANAMVIGCMGISLGFS